MTMRCYRTLAAAENISEFLIFKVIQRRHFVKKGQSRGDPPFFRHVSPKRSDGRYELTGLPFLWESPTAEGLQRG